MSYREVDVQLQLGLAGEASSPPIWSTHTHDLFSQEPHNDLHLLELELDLRTDLSLSSLLYER